MGIKNLKNSIVLNIMAICGYIILYCVKYFYFNLSDKYMYQTEFGRYIYKNPAQEGALGTIGILFIFGSIIFHLIMYIAYVIELLFKKHNKISKRILYTNPFFIILFYIGILTSFLPDFTFFYALTTSIFTFYHSFMVLIVLTIFYLIIFLIFEITERIFR